MGVGMGGFEPSPIEPSEVPPALYAEMQAASPTPPVAALGQSPPPPPERLSRQTSLMSDADLQTADVVLTSAPAGRHLFRIRVKLADSRMVAPHYLLILPRLKTADTGHARYIDHNVRIEA